MTKSELKDVLDQIIKGAQTEKEHHVTDLSAIQIALDHLIEDPEYYTKLSTAGLEEGVDLLNTEEYTVCDEDAVNFVHELRKCQRESVLEEAKYKGRSVPLNKPMQGDVKKFKVYVKNQKGNIVKVNFGDPNMRIKKSNPARRKSFRARHKCATPGPKWKARYWSCRKW